MKNKIYKLLSIFLAVMIAFSCCTVAFTVSAEEETIDATYYVSETGSDVALEDGTVPDGSSTHPVATIGKAIELANAKHVAGETVALKLSGTVTFGTWSEYSYNLIIDSVDAASPATISSSGNTQMGYGTNSTTTYRNVSFTNTSGEMTYRLFDSKNVVFESTVSGISGAKHVSLGTVTDSGAAKSVAGHNYTFNCPVALIYLSNDGWQSKTYTEDVNITINNSDAKPLFYLNPAGNCNSTYKKNFNLNFKDASSITFRQQYATTTTTHSETGETTTTVTEVGYNVVEGAMQIINSTGVDISEVAIPENTVTTTNGVTGATSALQTVTGAMVTAEDGTVSYNPLTKYILTNTTTDYKDALDFTETAGVFDVKEGYTVIATKADDEAVVVSASAPQGSQDVQLDLRAYTEETAEDGTVTSYGTQGAGAGEYNFQVIRLPRTKTYYVSATGNDTKDGSDATDNALLTVNQAITLAKEEAGLGVADNGEKDTVYVNVVGTDTVYWGGVIPAYDYKLVVRSNEEGTVATVTNTENNQILLGEARFESINLSGWGKGFRLNFNNVTFDENSTFGVSYGMVGSSKTNITEPVTINIDGTLGGTNFDMGNDWGGAVTYNAPLTINVNNYTSNQLQYTGMTLGSRQGITYNAPLNINIKNAKLLKFYTGTTAPTWGDYGAFQFINSTGIDIMTTGTVIGTASDGSDVIFTSALDDISASKKYILINNTDNKDLLSFPENAAAGVYDVNIDTDFYDVKATRAADEENGITAAEFTAKDGQLKVDGGGVYTITYAKKPNLEATYYVASTGNDETGTGADGKEFLTVNAAIAAANTKGYGDGDIVTVIVEDSVNWGSTTVTPHEFNLVVDSNAESAPTVTFATTTSTIRLGGDTEFKFVKLGYGNAWSSLQLNNADVIFSSTANTPSYPVMFGIGGTDGVTYEIPGQTVEFNNAITASYIRIANSANGNMLYTGDVNVIINNSSASPMFDFRTEYNGCGQYEANTNFILKSAKSIGFKDNRNTSGRSTIDHNGAVQIIMDGTPTISDDSKTYLSGTVAPEKGVYYIYNQTGVAGAISPVANTAGTFEISGIDTEMNNILVNGEIATLTNGCIELSEGGEYTITYAKKTGIKAHYFISASGDDSKDGKTKDTAVLTLNQALVLANDRGYGEGDTVYFNIVGADAINSGKYSEDTYDNLPAWEYQAVIRAYEPDVTKATITMVNTASLGGPTRFESVTVGGGYNTLRLGFQDVVFDENSSYGLNEPAIGWYHSAYKGKEVYGVTVELQGSQSNYGLYLGNQYGGVNHNGPVTIKINKLTNLILGFYLGHANGNSNTYYNAVNISLKETNRAIILNGASTDTTTGTVTSYFSFEEGSAFQFINSTGYAFDTGSGTTTTLAQIPETQKYILTNNTGNKDLLDFTSTIGTFKVSGIDETRYFVRATSKDGSVVKDSANGELTVPAGEYTITLERTEGLTKDYYINGTGSDDADGTSDKPFATVADAIAAAKKAEYTTGDEITVKVKGTDAVAWETAEDYDFKLIVETDSAQTDKATVDLKYYDETNAKYVSVAMTGDVEFKNIVLGTDYKILAAGNDVTLGADVEGALQFNLTEKTTTGQSAQKIEFYNAQSSIYLGNYNSNHSSYDGDVNVTVDNAAATPSFSFMAYWGGNIKFNQNLNINIKNAASVAFNATSKEADSTVGTSAGTATVGGAAQLVMPSNASIDTESIANFKSLTDNYYIVYNGTGSAVEIAGAGVFTVDENTTVYAYKNGVKVATSDSGTLTLTGENCGAGEYVLVTVEGVQSFNYTNADGTTIADMIAKAIRNGATENSVLNITLTGTTAIEYGTPVDHLFDVVITSTESTPVSFVNDAILAGDTKFDGVTFKWPGGESSIWFGGHDVEITAASTVSGGYYIGLGNNDTNKTYDSQTVVINCSIGSPRYFILGGDWANVTYSGDLNITLSHASSKPYIYFGMHGTNTYNGRVNINLGSSAPTGIRQSNASLNGGLNIISEDVLSDDNYTALASLTGDVYTVYNKTGDSGILGFGEKSGEFTVSNGETVRAISVDTPRVAQADGNYYADSTDGKFTVAAGNYFIGYPDIYAPAEDGGTNDSIEETYAEYIDDRFALNGKHALNNFAKKINNKESVNVVYYGGSVTAGQGASNNDKTSWRGIISSWLEVNAPNANVTNINSAIGGTGSFFGNYRIQEAVLDQSPDLLFIEFSINDYYDNQVEWAVGETEAARRFESIVVKVREALPECDIVTVLTGEVGTMDDLINNDKLHAQARGHYKICEKYGIPTIRVAHALADQIKAEDPDWTNALYTSQKKTYDTEVAAGTRTEGDYTDLPQLATWRKYVTDIVHPADNGYRIYANVIEEFMANSLLGDVNKEAATATHEVPDTIVSADLLDGNIKVYEVSEEMSANSATLGGDVFTVDTGDSRIKYFENYFNIANATVAFEFTGTELGVVAQYGGKTYSVVIVNKETGEEVVNGDVTVNGINPGIIATDLPYGTYVATITGKGEWARFHGFTTRDQTQQTIRSEQTVDYYVCEAGVECATCGTNAVSTVSEAVQAGEDAGLLSRDTVNVWVHGSVLWGTSVEHDFQLNVATNSNVTETATVDASIRADNLMKGDVAFDNINVKGNTSYGLNAYGNNLTIGSGATVTNGITATEQSQTIKDTQTIAVNNAFTNTIHLGHGNYGEVTHTADFNLIINNASATPTFAFNGYHGGANKYTNVNFIINDAKSVAFSATSKTFTSTDATTGETTTKVVTSRASGAVQLLIPSDTAIDDTSIENLYSLSDTQNVYYVENALGEAGTISFVEGEIGKFTVNVDREKYFVYVTDEDGNKEALTSSDLVLDAAGKYTVTVEETSQKAEYNVSSDGTIQTIAAAINKAKEDGFGINDFVTVWVSGDTVQWGTADELSSNTLPVYEFTLIINSQNPGTTTIGEATKIIFNGPTQIDNVILSVYDSNWPTFGFGGNDMTLGSGVTFTGTTDNALAWSPVTGKFSGGLNVKQAQDIVIEAPLSKLVLGNSYTNNEYNADLNIAYDNASSSISFYFGTSAENSETECTTFNKNVNINLKAAKGASFNNVTTYNPYVFAETSALQVVNGAGLEIDFEDLSEIDVANKYIINNETGNKDAISFTETAGTFNIDLGAEMQEQGYSVKVLDEAGNVVEEVKGDSFKVEAGKIFTVIAVQDPKTKTYDNITGISLAEAIQTAIGEGYGWGDTVTLSFADTEIDNGTLPKYNFNLVVTSAGETQTQITLGDSKIIANNQGMHTHYKNVKIYNESANATIALANSNVTFDKDVVFSTGGQNTIVFGTYNGGGKFESIKTNQTVVFNCAPTAYISLSNGGYANREYHGDINLVINHKDAAPTIFFNAYHNGANGTTTYYGNVSLNIKQANSVTFGQRDGAYFNTTDYDGGILKVVQLITNGNTTIQSDSLNWLKTADYYYDEGSGFSLGQYIHIIDNTYQRRVVELGNNVGEYNFNTDLEVTATFGGYEHDWVADGSEIISEEPIVVTDSKLVLPEVFYNNIAYTLPQLGTWTLTTNEYFEDFNDTTIDELHNDWKFTSDVSSTYLPDKETALTEDGKLSIISADAIREIPALNINQNISSKEQYISVDMQVTDFYDSYSGWYNGLEIMARKGLDEDGNGYTMNGYQFQISNGFIRLQKLDGNKTGDKYTSTNAGFVTDSNGDGVVDSNDSFVVDGLWGRLPGSTSVGEARNTFTLNKSHTYRVGLSVTTGEDTEGNEIAYVRGILLDLDTNSVIFDDTFVDYDPYKGTDFAIYSPGGNCDVYIDNLWFSNEKFREGDDGLVGSDINGDGIYDVRDLVFVDEYLDGIDNPVYLNVADKNLNAAIDTGDTTIIGTEILTDYVKGEFDYQGNDEVEDNADTMRKNILGSTSNCVDNDDGTYTYTATTTLVDGTAKTQTYTRTGKVWYVSDGTEDGAGTMTSPFTLAQVAAKVNPDASVYTDTSVYPIKAGDAILFERDKEYRTNDLSLDISTSGVNSDSYSYIKAQEDILMGAWGTGDKPRFIDSVKNYADEATTTWTETAEGSNIWVVDAPEIIIDNESNDRTSNKLYASENSATNIVFTMGNTTTIGKRRAFPTSAVNGGEIYTLYKDGQFTYDEVNEKLYIYSKINPNEYDSIEVSRGIYAIQLNSHENEFIIDNLAFQGFGGGAIYGGYGNNNLIVTNCEFGYSGGIMNAADTLRSGNAVGLWCGGSNMKVNYNWIYQTWDSAISPQGNIGATYDGFEVIGNLFEYNNCDIEIFDRGDSEDTNKANKVEEFVDETEEASWTNNVWSDNIMRFTTLGWGSRQADKIRGIQGVIRGSLEDAASVQIDWKNNTIDSPGLEIFKFNNTTAHTDTYTVVKKDGVIVTDDEGNYTYSVSSTIDAIFKFGDEGSALGGNKYYINPNVRNGRVIATDYMTMLPSEGSEVTSRLATTAAECYSSIIAIDTAASVYWLGTQVTSGN